VKRPALLLIPFIAAGICAQAQAGNTGANAEAASGQKITASAVWQPPSGFITKTQNLCQKSAGPMSFPECFVNQIASSGAPGQAVSFSRMLFDQSIGQVGIMSAFKEYGTVDAAQVLYPLRANDNYALLLVNGDPNVVDVDDLQKLDRSAMEQDPKYQALKQKYPQADVIPGDRSGSNPWPQAKPLPDGGTQFVVAYPLVNGCHACERVGSVRFAWEFDSAGKFQRTTYIPMPSRTKAQPWPTPHPVTAELRPQL